MDGPKQKGPPPETGGNRGQRHDSISDIFGAKSSPDITALTEAIREHATVTAEAFQDASDRLAAAALFPAFRKLYGGTDTDLLTAALTDVQNLRNEQARRRYEAERAALDDRKGGAL